MTRPKGKQNKKLSRGFPGSRFCDKIEMPKQAAEDKRRVELLELQAIKS